MKMHFQVLNNFCDALSATKFFFEHKLNNNIYKTEVKENKEVALHW